LHRLALAEHLLTMQGWIWHRRLAWQILKLCRVRRSIHAHEDATSHPGMVVVVFPLSPFPPDLCPHGTRKRESNGALDFDGFCWMGGRNNQPKMGRNDGISFGEDGAQGDDNWGGRCRIVCANRFRGKNKDNEIRRGYVAANRRLHATTNQINAGAMGGGYLRDGLVDGCVEGFYFIL
jgi:hypothetical protein